MTSFRPALVENSVEQTYASQLEADLSTGVRGGNKFRLIARCWVAARYGADCGLNAADYDRFRTEWSRKTYAALHQAFDNVLPAQYRAAGARVAASAAKPLSKKAEKLARSFERTPELSAEQRAWVIAQGGVEALDGRRCVMANGRIHAVLDGSWYGTAQTVQHLIEGRKKLI